MAEKKMYGYRIGLVRHTDHYEHDGEQYGSWSGQYSHTLDSKALKTEEYADAVSPFDIPKGSNALVVWVQWGSGDSFGFGEGSSAEVIGIFTDLESATSLQKQIYEHDESNKSEYHFKTPDGQEFKCGFAGWSGYFERLETVNIDTVTVW